MPKVDCKYWDKCYQRNEQHLQKYNHPEKRAKSPEDQVETVDQTETEELGEANGMVSKRKSGEEKEDSKGEYETDELRKEVLGNIAGKNYVEIFQKRIRLSVEKEYKELLRSNEFIRHKFLVEMPEDFYKFWKFLQSLVRDGDILKRVEDDFQLLLVGPFEFLGGRFDNAKICEPGHYLRHWRFFYDPPEFQTIFVRKGSGKHYGYWRDEPKDKEGLLLARNDSNLGCEFEFVSGNVFDAFLYFLENDFPQNPFTTSKVKNAKQALSEYVKSNEIQLQNLDSLVKERSKKVVTKTFHRAGIVVPIDSKTKVGYRPLMVSDAKLKEIICLFDKAETKTDGGESIKTVVMEKLQPIVTAATIAVDECDFGTSLELGIDLFCSGRTELHSLVLSLLVPAYTLMSRPQFIAITKAHLENRRREINLSIFNDDSI